MQTLTPTAVRLNNLSGSAADLDDSPDAPDGAWCTQLGAYAWFAAPSVGTVRFVGQTPAASAPSGDELVVVNFASGPSDDTYTGSVGSLAVDARNGTPTPYHEYVSDGGWGSGGAAKFYGSTSGGGVYRGFVPSYSGSPSQINIRYLMKWNSAWSGTASGYGGGASNLKGNIFDIGSTRIWTQEKDMNSSLGAAPAPYFQLAQSYNNTLYRIHGGVLDSGTDYTVAGSDANSSKWGDLAFLFGQWVDEWVCFEYELASSGRCKYYIWTSDRTFDGPYMEATGISSGTIAITGISGMYFHDSGAASGSYIMIDELVIASGYIGPPAGF